MVRIKHRYLLVNVLYPESSQSRDSNLDKQKKDVPYTVQFHQPSPDSLNAKLIARLVRDGVSDLFGDYGSGMVSGSLVVKYFSPATSTAIIRVARAHYRMVWAALTFTTRLPKPIDRICVMQVVRVSGTIKKAEEEAIRRARLGIIRARKAAHRSGTAASGLRGTLAGNGADTKEDEDADIDMMDGIEDPDESGDEEDDEG